MYNLEHYLCSVFNNLLFLRRKVNALSNLVPAELLQSIIFLLSNISHSRASSL